VTFDTGGICLKPGGNMVPMKGDMAGAASVLGVFKAIGHLMPETRVVGVIPCADNMPDSRAYKPGDVVTSLSGQTVEIINTDAEGRLLLADALTYAGRFKPRLLVDIATLTGACVVALGNHVGAAFSPDLDLTRRVSDADKPLAEHFWPMPLLPLYARELESEVADVKNVGKREGGAVHAAKFLERFVPENTPWLHLDIAGPGYGEAKTAFCPKGGTGYGVPTLLSLVLEHDEE
jgi:leucyl aminopeptidase